MLTFEIAAPQETYGKYVQGRVALYLDHNIWIDLADRKTDLAVRTWELAKLAVDVGLLICPVSYPAITELLKQGKNLSSIGQAHVMDALSCGVSMRAERHIIDIEVQLAHAFLSEGRSLSRRQEMFTIVGCYVSDNVIEFPDGWFPNEAAEMAETVRRNLPSVTWLLEYLPIDQIRTRHAASDETYVERVRFLNSDLDDFRDKRGKLKASALRLEEHTYVLKQYVARRLPRVVGVDETIAGFNSFEARGGKAGPQTAAKIVNAMPSTSLSCELQVQRRLAGRPPRPQDWFDHEHAVLGVPYCEAFASSDGELLDLLRKAKVTQNYGTRLLRGLSDVASFVADLLDSVTLKV